MPLRHVQRRIYTKLGIVLLALLLCFFATFAWLVKRVQLDEMERSAAFLLEWANRLEAGDAEQELAELQVGIADWEGEPELFLRLGGRLFPQDAASGDIPADLVRLWDDGREVPRKREGYLYWQASSERANGLGQLLAIVRFKDSSVWGFVLERYSALFLLGAGFLVSVIASLLVLQGRLVFRPLSRMLRSIESGIEGVSASLPPWREQSDEFESLAARYDELIEVLERQGKELQFRNDELRHLLDALPAYIWFKDDQNNIVRLNRAAAESVGYSVEELEGRAVAEIFPEEAEAYFRDDKAVIESGKAKLGYVESYSPVNGERRTVRTDKIPYVNEEGKVTGVVVLVTDITELVHLQEEREASDRLIRRLVEIGNWEAAGVEERIAAGLKDTCETLGMKTGILSEISGDLYTVRQVHDEGGKISKGSVFRLDEVYCQFVVMTGRSMATNHLGETAWGRMKCYETLRLESYIASPIRKGDEIVGTINFSSPEIRERPFAQFEIDAVRLLSNWIEGLLRQEEIVDQLNRQKAELRLILDTTPSQIWFKDDRNRILRANRAAAAHLGLEVEEVEGKLTSELLPLEADRSYEEDRSVLESGEPMLGRIRSVTTIGNRNAWFRYDKLPYRLDDERSGVIVVASDITELVESQAAVKEADERFRAAVEESPVGMLIVDSELRVVMVNGEAERIFGYEREELLWGSVDRLLGSRVMTALSCVFDADELVEDQVRLGADGKLLVARKDGTELPVEVIVSLYSLSGDSFAMVSIFDVTARIESQSALHDSEERFQLAAKGASVGIWDWFNINGSEEWWSPRFYELIGYEPGELPSSLQSFKELLHPDDVEPTFAAVDKSLKEGTPFEADYRLLRKDGTYHWFFGSGMASFDEDGVPRRMTGTIQDINDRKIAEEELSRAVTDLKRANEELSNFAFLSSHDLQEPLRTISSFLHLLKDRYGPGMDREANEYMDFTLVAVERVQNMIRSLLGYCSLDSKRRAASLFNLQEAVDLSLRDLTKRIEERGVEISVVDALGSVYGDRNQISLVFQNLFSNAIKFNRSDRPTIKIACRTVSSFEIGREELREGDYTVVSIADNGIGIREKYQKRIFSIFQKLHPSGEYEGSGIGLSMVQKIMQQHEGYVWLESEEGKGSCFYLAFPKCEAN
ncbi:PAS domain S-box protein [Pelagicoccus sp. NFK12]|uniref:histidine kinase n=1 Tax=Pelagicoccus enzymogenes TaxID=2773457 RepID=A0A927F912_9BACT|nr:PAS domain S-box protein [Pelagicoccus enzymogenes]MBD5780562.1 PAS domain S-box protein [Pelagicoccus enzymogenes]